MVFMLCELFKQVLLFFKFPLYPKLFDFPPQNSGQFERAEQTAKKITQNYPGQFEGPGQTIYNINNN